MLVGRTTWVALLCAASETLAQTFTSCDPTKKSTQFLIPSCRTIILTFRKACPDDPALTTSTYTHDFAANGADDTAWKTTAGNVSYTSSGAEFTISKQGDAPTIQSNWYIFFGRVSFFLKAAPGKGIVSSAILESDDLDETDWEWLGGDVSRVQTNYFGKGNTTTFDRGGFSDVAETQTKAHNYTIAWTSTATTWLIDSVPVRTLNFADAVGGKNYPQTPMNIRIGIWAGGDPGNDPGTIEWAGGPTDYAAGPYTMVLEKVEVVNERPGQSYTYGDMSGSFESIKVNGEGAAASAGNATEGAAPAPAPAVDANKGSSAPAEAPAATGPPAAPEPPVASVSPAPAPANAAPAPASADSAASSGFTTATATPTPTGPSGLTGAQAAGASALAEKATLSPTPVGAGSAVTAEMPVWWCLFLGGALLL